MLLKKEKFLLQKEGLDKITEFWLLHSNAKQLLQVQRSFLLKIAFFILFFLLNKKVFIFLNKETFDPIFVSNKLDDIYQKYYNFNKDLIFILKKEKISSYLDRTDDQHAK
jgi:hypothetical protein